MSIEKFGTEANVKGVLPNVPRTGGSGEIQSLGSKAPLSDSPASAAPWGGHGNPIDGLGSKAPLSSTPRKGWDGHNTPMSKRALQQGK